MSLRVEVRCTCHPNPVLHGVGCLITAANTPYAMINAAGEVFYPDGPEDALLFAADHGAEFLHTDFRWSEVDNPTPTTGGPFNPEDYGIPEGCRCYIREDIEYGDVLTRPPDGCPVHPRNLGLADLISITTPLDAVTPPHRCCGGGGCCD